MVDIQNRSHGGRAVRRTRRFGQPESMAALRPSQRRAAANLASRREQRSVADWLRRLTAR